MLQPKSCLKKEIKKLKVSYNFKDDSWNGFINLKINNKPYQLIYFIKADDLKAGTPYVLYEPMDKIGEGWSDLSDKQLKDFKYQELYAYPN